MYLKCINYSRLYMIHPPIIQIVQFIQLDFMQQELMLISEIYSLNALIIAKL